MEGRFLAAQNISFSYGGKKTALHDFSLTVENENFVAVLGPNGCGKTTLIKILAGILRPASGSVEVLGRPVHANTDPSKILAYVPQTLSLGFSLSVLDFVLLGVPAGGPFGKVSRRAVDRARAALALMNMEAYADRDMLRLSGGERQKIILSKALAQDTPVILLDEPVTHLDLCGQLEILELLKKMSLSAGKKILAIMHEINFAARYSDYAVIMKDGGLFAAGKTPLTLTTDAIESCFSVAVEKRGDFFVPWRRSVP